MSPEEAHQLSRVGVRVDVVTNTFFISSRPGTEHMSATHHLIKRHHSNANIILNLGVSLDVVKMSF